MGLVRPVRQVGLVGLVRRLCEKAGPWGRAEYSLTMHTESEGPLLPHGGYRKMRSYKVAQAVYDATVVFCRRFFAQDRRMTDQMVQAARSGVRNISEGSGSAATSRKTEMKLTNVARASLSDRKPMVQRRAKAGPMSGESFWGCSGYPDCRTTRPFQPEGSQ